MPSTENQLERSSDRQSSGTSAITRVGQRVEAVVRIIGNTMHREANRQQIAPAGKPKSYAEQLRQRTTSISELATKIERHGRLFSTKDIMPVASSESY